MQAVTEAPRTEARFPGVERKAGHYESFYIKACRPGGGLGVWIRHTIHKAPAADPTGSLWFTLFDAEADGPVAGKLTVGADRLAAAAGAYIEIGEARFEPARARGSMAIDGFEASWDLALSAGAEPYFHLPRPWMYRASLPRTKFLSPHPNSRFDGEVSVNGQATAVDAWHGMVGHNWGAQHAERWVWIEGTELEGGSPGDYFDAALGRIKVGPATTPWVGNGRLVLDGRAYRLAGIEKARRTRIDGRPTSCDFVLPGAELSVRGRVSAPAKDFVAWVYADPDGPEHNTLNCSIADLELTVEAPGGETRRLAVNGAAAYEIGMRETDHGIAVQPFPDG